MTKHKLNKEEWENILDRAFIDTVPEKYMKSVNIILESGDSVFVKDGRDLVDALSMIEEEVVDVEFTLNYAVIKNTVTKEIQKLTKEIFV